MRISRHLGIYSQGVPDLEILTTTVSLQSSSYYTRTDSNPDNDDYGTGAAKNWTKTVNLSNYKKVHFQVTGGNSDRSISVGVSSNEDTIKKTKPSVGEHILDISSITNRSALIVKIHTDYAEASRPSFYPATNTVYNEIAVSHIWATAN